MNNKNKNKKKHIKTNKKKDIAGGRDVGQTVRIGHHGALRVRRGLNALREPSSGAL